MQKRTTKLFRSGLVAGVLFVLVSSASGQVSSPPPNPPVPVEFMGGNNRFAFQTLINKKFSPQSRFDLLSVTSSASAYRNDAADFDFINTSNVSYDLFKGLGVSGGVSLNARNGFSPIVGIQYVFTRPTLLVVVAPDVYLTNHHNAEGIIVLEYKPHFSRDWSMYSRLQFLYNYDLLLDQHSRSYFDIRLGPAIGSFAFGAGCNFDWYGPSRVYKDNYGLFVRYNFE